MRRVPEVAVTPVGAVACAALPFWVAGALHVAVMAKATFRLVADRPMVRAPAEALVRADVAGTPPYLQLARDLVPYRPRAEVLLRGSVQRGGRLALWGSRGTLVDKRGAAMSAFAPLAPTA